MKRASRTLYFVDTSCAENGATGDKVLDWLITDSGRSSLAAADIESLLFQSISRTRGLLIPSGEKNIHSYHKFSTAQRPLPSSPLSSTTLISVRSATRPSFVYSRCSLHSSRRACTPLATMVFTIFFSIVTLGLRDAEARNGQVPKKSSSSPSFSSLRHSLASSGV